MREEWKAPLGSFHLLISHSLASGDEFVASIVLSTKRKTQKLEEEQEKRERKRRRKKKDERRPAKRQNHTASPIASRWRDESGEKAIQF